MSLRAEKLEDLRTELAAARAQLESARQKRESVGRAAIQGMPRQDAQQVARVYEQALKGYANALRDLSRALLHPQSGLVPHSGTAGGRALTPRELAVLTLIAQGKSTKEVANELGMAFRTAVCHRYRITAKVGARNTADLTRLAIRLGLLEP